MMLMTRFGTSERLACHLVGLSRTTWRYQPMPRNDEVPFRAEVIRLACMYGRYGYRMIAALMRNGGGNKQALNECVASGVKRG